MEGVLRSISGLVEDLTPSIEDVNNEASGLNMTLSWIAAVIDGIGAAIALWKRAFQIQLNLLIKVWNVFKMIIPPIIKMAKLLWNLVPKPVRNFFEGIAGHIKKAVVEFAKLADNKLWKLIGSLFGEESAIVSGSSAGMTLEQVKERNKNPRKNLEESMQKARDNNANIRTNVVTVKNENTDETNAILREGNEIAKGKNTTVNVNTPRQATYQQNLYYGN